MPLVNIYVLKGSSKEYIKSICDGVNSAVIEAMGFPEDDRYQIVNEIEDYGLEYQSRIESRVMLSLIMREGKSENAKKTFYSKVVDNLGNNPGIKRENILITIVENKDIDWSFKNGVAQFVS